MHWSQNLQSQAAFVGLIADSWKWTQTKVPSMKIAENHYDQKNWPQKSQNKIGMRQLCRPLIADRAEQIYLNLMFCKLVKKWWRKNNWKNPNQKRDETALQTWLLIGQSRFEPTCDQQKPASKQNKKGKDFFLDILEFSFVFCGFVRKILLRLFCLKTCNLQEFYSFIARTSFWWIHVKIITYRD